MKYCRILVFLLLLFVFEKGLYAQWRIYVSNSVCMDNTWYLTDKQNKEFVIDLMKENLDAMKRTDNEAWQNRARYTCTVANEVFYFLERYPERKNELTDRLRSGQIMMSPFLVNTNWGFTGVEGFLRNMYPSKRFVVENGLTLSHAVHSELPGLPWDIVPLLSGSGIRWISKPYLDFDASFAKLTNPPLFILVGPDSSTIKVVLDKHASEKYAYIQASGILKILPYAGQDTTNVRNFWLDYYSALPHYPVKAVIAEGTHSDLSERSHAEVGYVTDKIIELNRDWQKPFTIINSTFPMFADLVDSVERSEPFLTSEKGSFGHTWELWPVCMAKYASALRKSEHRLVSAEALFASAGIDFKKYNLLYSKDKRAEWLQSMFQDHAWNGSDTSNRSENALIRKGYSNEIVPLIDSMIADGFAANGLRQTPNTITVYNPSSYKRSSIVEFPVNDLRFKDVGIWRGKNLIPSQKIFRNDDVLLCFMTDSVRGFGFESYRLRPGNTVTNEKRSPFKVILNQDNISVDILGTSTSVKEASLQLKYQTDTTYYAHFQKPVMISDGPVAEIYSIQGSLPYTDFVLEMIINKINEHIDFNVNIDKRINTRKEALYMIWRLPSRFIQHIETTASVIKPYLAPKGDMLEGADLSRIVMQSVVNAEYENDGGVMLSSSDAFALTPSDTALIVELLGNNNNYNEAIKDQNNENHFRFGFSTAFYAGAYSQVRAQTFGYLNQMPMLVEKGEIVNKHCKNVEIVSDCIRATAYKPSDPTFGNGTILRLWNTSPRKSTALIKVNGIKNVWLADLLEQNLVPVDIKNNVFLIEIRGNGLAAVRLVP